MAGKLHIALIIGLFLGLCNNTFAQKRAEATEINAKCLSENYYMLPIGEGGLLVFSENIEKQDAKAHYWTVSRYSSDFKEVFTKEFKVNFVVDFDKYCLSPEGKLHLLFTEHTTAAYNSYVSEGYYQIFTINPDSGTIKLHDGKLDFKIAIQGFQVLGSTVFLGGKVVPGLGEVSSLKAMAYMGLGIPFLFNITYIPSTPVLAHISLEDGSGGVIDLKYDGSAEVSAININESTGWVDITLSEFNTSNESKVYVSSYDGALNFRGTQVLKAKGSNLLMSANLQTIQSSNTQYLSGLYAVDQKTKGNENKDNNADGFYLARLGEIKPAYVQYYNFSKLKNFLRPGTGNEQSYNLLFHKMIELSNGQLVMVAEVYSPEYSYDEKVITDEKLRLKRQTVPSFDKYQFTQVVACGIDSKSGKMLWNEVYDIDILSTTSLAPKCIVKQKGEKVAIIFPQKGALRYKVLNSKETMDNREIARIPVAYFGESSTGETLVRCDMQSWYGNYVYTSGFSMPKIIRNQPKPNKPVFNFSKLSLAD